MKHRISNLKLACVILASTAVAGCGWGWLFGGGGGGNNRVTIVGTIDSVSPNTDRDIVIFVYSVDDKNLDDGRLCPCPGLPCDVNSGEAVVIEDGENDFTVEKVNSGAIRIVFLLDNAGDGADGQIDDGDLVAVLDDDGCELDDVPNHSIVTLEDVDLDFAAIDLEAVDDRCHGNDDSTTTTDEEDSCEIDDPPADGRARANNIQIDDDDDDN